MKVSTANRSASQGSDIRCARRLRGKSEVTAGRNGKIGSMISTDYISFIDIHNALLHQE
jgi:hypothetical protein